MRNISRWKITKNVMTGTNEDLELKLKDNLDKPMVGSFIFCFLFSCRDAPPGMGWGWGQTLGI